MLEKLAIDPVRNPESSYMKSLGMTAEEANTSTWTAPSASNLLRTTTPAVQSQPPTTHTTRLGRWGKKSDIPLKEELIAATPTLVDVSDTGASTKLHTSSWLETKTAPANAAVPAMMVKSFASAAAAPRTNASEKTTTIPTRQQATTSAWGQQAAPSTPVAAAFQGLKSAITNPSSATSKGTQQEPSETATSTESVASTTAIQSDSVNTEHKWDMPKTAGWETFGTQSRDSVTNDSEGCSVKSTPVSTASYAQSIASTNTEPCSPTSPADVTTELGRLSINSTQPQAIYPAEEWNKIAEQGRNARCGRYYGQPGGRGNGGKRGGW